MMTLGCLFIGHLKHYMINTFLVLSGKQTNGGEERLRMFYNPIGKNRLFIDHFVFVNRVNTDIGDSALVKLETVNNLFQNTQNSIFEISSDVLSSSNFLFLPLPGYVDLSAGLTKEAVDRNTEYPNLRRNSLTICLDQYQTRQHLVI